MYFFQGNGHPDQDRWLQQCTKASSFPGGFAWWWYGCANSHDQGRPYHPGRSHVKDFVWNSLTEARNLVQSGIPNCLGLWILCSSDLISLNFLAQHFAVYKTFSVLHIIMCLNSVISRYSLNIVHKQTNHGFCFNVFIMSGCMK